VHTALKAATPCGAPSAAVNGAQFAEPIWLAKTIGDEQVADSCAVYHTPLVGAGIAPWAQVLVSLKLEPPAEVQPGENAEQEDVGKKKVPSTPCREEQVLSEKQQVPELYAPLEGPEEALGA
jgi:hypothetical protein